MTVIPNANPNLVIISLTPDRDTCEPDEGVDFPDLGVCVFAEQWPIAGWLIFTDFTDTRQCHPVAPVKDVQTRFLLDRATGHVIDRSSPNFFPSIEAAARAVAARYLQNRTAA
jgi:hypothetical protein